MTVSGYGQIFDAFDRLVESQNAGGYTSIVYSPDGYKLALMNGSSVVKYMAPLAAGLQAVYTANTPAGVAYWRHADWLGSSRLAHDGNGNVIYDRAYAPFGEPYAETATTNRNFTGQTKDTSPANYDFLFRQYSPAQGRWLVPDPAGLAAVDPTNPQTWNRYAYALNNPLSNIDPLGQECVWDDGSYDSNDDPDSGSPEQCKGLGGQWVDHSFFQNTMNNGAPWADWSPNANSTLTCGGITPPAGPINYSASAQSNSQTGVLGWYQAFSGNGTQDFKGNPAFGAPANQVAVGNFNFGASVAAKGWSLTTGQFLAGAGAVKSYAKSLLSWSIGQSANMQAQYGVSPNTVPQTPAPQSTVGPGFPGFPVMDSNGIMTQGDQSAPNENQAVVAGFLWQSLGCQQ